MKRSRRIVEAIFLGASSLSDPAERSDYLDSACGGDQALCSTVQKMLAAQDEAERFFAKSAPDADANGRGLPAFDERVGERIGAYKLLKKIGEGGWATVYLAEQEEPVIRRVALKVIKLGLDTRSVIGRFEAERQALALMDHPHIARVLDAGATVRGRPFFVMEVVDGIKITEFCDGEKISLRQRLNLFIQVCHAVQHAHQKGVIHRDLKPANILVTMADGEPLPKVIDFGIAKATDGKLTQQTASAAVELLAGTPAYMSPEQAEAGAVDVDTRSDIYSLGVLLYELVTGAPPFTAQELMSGNVAHLRRMLQEMQPQAPSEKLSALSAADFRALAESRCVKPSQLLSYLKDDLDWIILKALDKDRDRRYQTANDLAADVANFLADRPVVCRPASALYRLKKTVYRNRLAFATGATVAITLLAALTVSARMYVKTEKALAAEKVLRMQVEAREKLTDVAVLVKQGNYKAAADLLQQLQILPTHPTLDGIQALRSVGMWLAVQGRLNAAVDRYAALLKIDGIENSDVIAWDYQAYSVLLAETGDVQAYDRFRQKAISQFSSSTSSADIGRILDGSLLSPVSTNVLAQLQPLASTLEKWTREQPTNNIRDMVALSFWKFRQGDLDAAIFDARHSMDSLSYSAYDAIFHAIIALSLEQRGEIVEAQAELEQARLTVDKFYKYGTKHGNHFIGYWQDWFVSRSLVREGTAALASHGRLARRNSSDCPTNLLSGIAEVRPQ